MPVYVKKLDIAAKLITDPPRPLSLGNGHESIEWIEDNK